MWPLCSTNSPGTQEGALTEERGWQLSLRTCASFLGFHELDKKKVPKALARNETIGRVPCAGTSSEVG